MKTFDVSVNVLNNNVLSDKLLWKERQVSSSKAVERPVEIVVQQVDAAEPVCNWRPPEFQPKMLLLLVPFACVVSFLVVFEFASDKPFVTTLLGCALVLSTPVVLMLVYQRRVAVKNDTNVQILLLHAAGLFTILNHKITLSIFVVFALIFAYLAWQTFVRRAEQPKDFTTKLVLYLVVALVNAVVVVFLMLYSTLPEPSGNLVPASSFKTDILSVSVFMLSLSIYVSHNYI